MTLRKMAAIWKWFTQQIEQPLDTPHMAVGVVAHGYGHQEWLGLCYQSGFVLVKPWVARWTVIHEFSHWLFWNARIEYTAVGDAFLAAVGRSSWDYTAIEQFASTMCGILCGRWRGNPVKRAAPALYPLLSTTGATLLDLP